MKSIRIIRKVDELGRIVIPIDLRRILDIKVKDPIKIFVDEDKIILRKYTSEKACALTGEVTKENKTLAGGKLVLSSEGAELLVKEIESHFAIRV